MKPRLSICMMVKNEEKNLERCLKSLQTMRNAFPSELIIVDTGSEDNTVEIAKRFTDQVYFHSWGNNFSEIRNITISYGKGEWFLIIDADEELHNCQPLIDFLKSPKRNQYATVAFTTKNIVNLDDPQGYSSMVGFRMFKNDGYFHFEGAIHNQAKFKGEALAMPEVYLLHYGYISTDKELMERKFLRTGTILKQELEKDPTNIYYWTQLSVTYAMHKDYEEAIEYAEKAYSLLPEKRTSNFMFVLLHLILVYQHRNKYERVAEVCREALSIKEGYLDVYYYYAESQAILHNNNEAIAYYEKYLELLKQRESQDERDVTIIEYTLGCQQLVYSNLMHLYKLEGKNAKALYYAEKVTDDKLLENNLSDTIELHIKEKQYQKLRKYYDDMIAEKKQSVFLDKLNQVVVKLEKDAQLELASSFKGINHVYGLLCTLMVEDDEGYITLETQEAVSKVKVEDLPVYCSNIFYYLMKWDYPLEKIMVNFKEVWLTCALEYVSKRHNDLSTVIYSYLREYTSVSNIHEYKLGKTLARCALLLDDFNEVDYETIFMRYLEDGTKYLELVYNPVIISDSLICELKNDEEVFLLLMEQANRALARNNRREYVGYLRKALKAFPNLKRGIEILLKKIVDDNKTKSTEFDMYKLQIKNTVRQFINDGKLNEAKQLLTEYKDIVPNDLEIVLLESQILLN